MTDLTPEALRERAAEAEARREASWQRSDTDGFLSQWASGIGADRDRMQADLIEAGGTARFLALFTVEGQWVPARQLEPRQYGWGRRWMVLDEQGRSTGTFLPVLPKRRDTLARRGYVEGYVMRPAEAQIVSSGTGLSGAASAHVTYVPTDRDTDRPAAVITADRWSEEQS